MSIQIPNQFETPKTLYPVREMMREEELDELEARISRHLGETALGGFRRAVEAENHAYSDIEAGLKKAIIGQPKAIETTVNALSREYLKDFDSPIASMLFLGPTGVGKTEIGKELTRQLHPDEDIDKYMLRIDCSSFQHGHNVGSLVGAPPGYIGHDGDPKFASPVLDQPYNIVIFDEIEKADPALYRLMLQIMQEGEIALQNRDEPASFRNSIIIMTSNLGADKMMQMLEPKTTGFQPNLHEQQLPSEEELEGAANESIKKHFAPEFINRLDSTVVFQPLDDEDLGQILDLTIEKANKRYADLVQVQLELTDELKQEIITSCGDRRQFGARPIVRKYQKMVESMLSKYVGTRSIPKASRVRAELTKDGKVELLYKRDNSLKKQPRPGYEQARPAEAAPPVELVPVVGI